MNGFQFEPLKQVRRGVLVDTDIGPDCDDVGALAVLHALAKRYHVPILGIVNCTSNPYGCGAIDVIGRYCGGGEFPIGMYEKEGFLNGEETMSYNRYLTEVFGSSYGPDGGRSPEAALSLYRRMLAQAEDGSVMLITISPLNNLAGLLRSSGDDVSPKSGLTLVAEKVYAIVSMAGCTQSKQREYNIVCDGDAAQIFLEEVPVPVIYSGVELGLSVFSGFESVPPKNAEHNPVFQAYRLFGETVLHTRDYQNRSFDLTAVHFAFEGEGEYYRLAGPGSMRIDRLAEDATEFVHHAEGTQYYLNLFCERQRLSSVLNGYLRNAGNDSEIGESAES